jgi:hypothetical protein
LQAIAGHEIAASHQERIFAAAGHDGVGSIDFT